MKMPVLLAAFFLGSVGLATLVSWYYSRQTFAIFYSPLFSGPGSPLVIRTPPSRLEELHKFIAALRQAKLNQIKTECIYIQRNFQGDLGTYSLYLKERGLIDDAAYLELKNFLLGSSEKHAIPIDVPGDAFASSDPDKTA